jgi:hypothetical protein
MIALLVEHAEPAAGAAVHHCEVVEKVQRAVVEPDVIVRTQAQYVLRNVGTVMRPAKRTDVRSFSVGARTVKVYGLPSQVGWKNANSPWLPS